MPVPPDDDLVVDDGPDDVSVDAPAPAAPRRAAPPAPRVLDGPWRNPKLLNRWMHEDAWHGWVVLGREAAESHAAYVARAAACERYLEAEAEGTGAFAREAGMILQDPRLRRLDEAAWREERERYRRGTPEWFDFDREVQRVLRPGVVTESAFEILVEAGAPAGLGREAVAEEVRRRAPAAWPPRREERPAILRFRDGPVATCGELVAYATGSREGWEEVRSRLPKVREVLEMSPSDEGARLAEAVAAAAAPNPDAALWGTIWRLGHRALRLPHPWSPRVVLAPDRLVDECDGDAGILSDVVANDVLALWLEHHGDTTRAARLRRVAMGAPTLAASALLWGLGETRLSVGGGPPLRSIAELRARLDVEDGALDAAILGGTLAAWADALGDADAARAVELAAKERGDARVRRLSLAWRLGRAELLPGVATPLDVVRLAEEEPRRVLDAVADGTLAAWARARRHAELPAPDASPERRLNEALWSLGGTSLRVGGTLLRTPAAAAAWGDAEEAAFERALPMLEAWVARVDPARAPALRAAVAAADRVEAARRALGAPAPAVQLEPLVLDLGVVRQGAAASRIVRITLEGTRGRAAVDVDPRQGGATLGFGDGATRATLDARTRSLALRVEVSNPDGQVRDVAEELVVRVDGVPRTLRCSWKARRGLGRVGATVGALGVAGLLAAALAVCVGILLFGADEDTPAPIIELATVPPPPAEPAPAKSPDLATQVWNGEAVPAARLDGLDCDALWDLRNRVYARHGYAFTTSRAKAHFARDPLYRRDAAVTAATIERRLSAADRANRDNVLAAEKAAGCRS